MKPGFLRFVSILFLIPLLLMAVPVSYARGAATTEPVATDSATTEPPTTEPPPPTVVSVAPSVIANNVDNTITVTGTGFDNTAVVQLGVGGVALDTSFHNAQTLTARVPAGFPQDSYRVVVSMNGGTWAGPTLTVNAPPPTAGPAPVARPQISVETYRTKPADVRYGEDFRLIVKLRNAGQANAYNIQASFTSTSFVPLKNGGVNIVGDLAADNSTEVDQTMTASSYVSGIVSIDMNLSYTDISGTVYTEKFTLNMGSVGGSGTYATSTPTGVKSSQLVITSYAASVDPLQPGEQFTLTMTVQNTGNARAQRVTMIVGGGSSGGTDNGTPQPGGVSGGSGEFANFAPVGASNVQTLGDLAAGGGVQASQNLIVNVSTEPGAYPMKVTFAYLNEKNETINDEQVITLLVYNLPKLDVSFYRPPDPFFVGQPGALPIQVVNLGKRASVLGTLKVASANGTLENGTSLIGSLDAGGYFTLDAMITPEQSGTVSLDITIDYTDDFNQPRTITRKLDIEVMEGMEEPTFEPGMQGGGGGAMAVEGEESTMHKIWRAVLGLLGLDSAPPPPATDPGMMPGIEEPIPAPKPGSGKG